MNDGPRIGVFHSLGHDYAKVLQHLRAAQPSARLVAIVPPEYAMPESAPGHADETVRTERSDYSPRDFAATLRLVGRLRREKFETFVIMFNSPQLRLLAAMSGARERLWCTPDGRLIHLRGSAPVVICDEAWHALRGRAIYAAVWAATHLLRTNRAA